MASVLDSFDNLIAMSQDYGPLVRLVSARQASVTTAATATSGSLTINRFSSNFVMPSMAAGLTGAYLTHCRMYTGLGNTILAAALEVSLGVLTVSGNSFAAGSAMPTRKVKGTSVTTASGLAVLVATAALTATTPTVTITYTNQSGTTGQTATLTLPTSPVANSGFLINPHLASGDTGIRAVTGMSISAGSAGTLTVYGLLPLAFTMAGPTAGASTVDPLVSPVPFYKVTAGDSVGFYSFGGTGSAKDLVAVVGFVGDDEI